MTGRCESGAGGLGCLAAARGCYRHLLCVAVFVVSFKFCAFISVEQGNFPVGFMEWLIFSCWPEALAPAVGGLALLGAVALYPLPDCRRDAWWIPGVALLTVLSGLPGLIHTTEWGYACRWMAHFGGNLCLVTAVWLASFGDRRLLPAVLDTLAVSGLISCAKGWRQHFGGLEANLRMMVENAAASGSPLPARMVAKLHQTRSYGWFMDPNIYAAHILLLGPVMVRSLAAWSRNFTPRRLSFVLFTGGGVALMLGAIVWSGSRGAALGLVAGAGILFWLSPVPRRWRVAALCLGLAGGAALLFLAIRGSGRGFATASVRLQYYQAAVRMFAAHPLAGVGLGEFFPWHMRLKAIGFEEARDAHSLFFAQLSQCGVLGGLAAAVRILFPFALALGFLRRYRAAGGGLFPAACVSWGAWNVHSLVQFNDLIPSTYSFVLVIGLAASDPGRMLSGRGLPGRRAALLRWALAVPALAVLLPLAELGGERDLQIGETRLRGGLPGAEGRLHAAAAELRFSTVPWRLLGELNMCRGSYRESVRCHRELVRRSPHRSSSLCRLARSLLLAGEEGAALEALREAEKWYPGSPQVCYLRALCRLVPELPAGGFLERQALLAGLAGMRTSLSEEGRRIRIRLEPAGPPDFRLPEELLRRLNDRSVPFFDGRPVVFER